MRRDDRPLPAGSVIIQKSRNVHRGHSCLLNAKLKTFPNTPAMGPMRVARPVNKWYNDNRKQNSTAAAGSANSPPPATGDLSARCNRIFCTAGILYPFRPPKARESSALHGTTIACAVLFCFHISFIIRRQNHGKAKSGSFSSHRAPYTCYFVANPV